jgi:hypothetical protein
MSHQGNSASLWRAAEKCDLGVRFLECSHEVHHRIPCILTTSCLEIIKVKYVGSASGVDLYNTSVADLK